MFHEQTDRAARFAALQGTDALRIFDGIETPAYVLEESVLRHNAEVMDRLRKQCGVKLLLAQKAFSNYDVYPLLSPYLDGTTASGLYETRLGKEKMPGKEVHVFCGAYREDEMEELLTYADTIVFNSIGQLARFGKRAKAAGKEIGLRVNPEYSTQGEHAIYDPCAPGSRLGITRAQWDAEMTDELMTLVSGIHMHTLCEQDADDLQSTVVALEERFGDVLSKVSWLNLGGGHHITRAGYEMTCLEQVLGHLTETYRLQLYLEPGEAWALNAGYLVTQVLDRTTNGAVTNLILDMSAECHTPDVIEMPYQPPLYGAQAIAPDPLQKAPGGVAAGQAPGGVAAAQESGGYIYRLGGPTCLAGDVIGDYRFAREVQIGDRLIFGDMAIYTMVKNNTFNGMRLPNIYTRGEDGKIRLLKRFGYEDFAGRLGS